MAKRLLLRGARRGVWMPGSRLAQTSTGHAPIHGAQDERSALLIGLAA